MSKRRHGAAVAALGIFLLGSASMADDNGRWKAGFPGSKMAIETPLKKIISNSTPSGFINEVRKSELNELRYAGSSASRTGGLKERFRSKMNSSDAGGAVPWKADKRSDIHNRETENAENSDGKYGRRVRPGLVGWHSDIEHASQMSKHTGRPVLVFQMMGRLDQEFC